MKKTLTVSKRPSMNQRFRLAPKDKKRVMIAKDVLRQLKSGKLVANTGSYVGISHYRLEDAGIEDPHTADIRSNYSKIDSCTVCALGACLMSATKFGNILDFGDVGGRLRSISNEKVKKLFSKIFTPKQLLLVEVAFEGNSWGADRYGRDVLGADLSYDEAEACDNFYCRYKKDGNRLRGIMKNIIKNKGEFIP